jgi:hypothetical protein
MQLQFNFGPANFCCTTGFCKKGHPIYAEFDQVYGSFAKHGSKWSIGPVFLVGPTCDTPLKAGMVLLEDCGNYKVIGGKFKKTP